MIGLVFEVPGATRTQYADVMALLGGMEHEVPGRLCHFAGPTDDGWLVVGIWTPKERFEEFLAEELIPAARKVGFFASLPRNFAIDHVAVSDRMNIAVGNPTTEHSRFGNAEPAGRKGCNRPTPAGAPGGRSSRGQRPSWSPYLSSPSLTWPVDRPY